MNKYFYALSLVLLLTSCQKSSNSVWNDETTTSQYFNKAKNFFWKSSSESRLVASEEEFLTQHEDEFIPLRDEDLKVQIVDFAPPQSSIEPGAKGASVPGIEAFKTPTGNLANIFRTVYFNTDDHTLRSRDYYDVVVRIATHMKKHPNVYCFIEGHCDERASESYNLALGTRRANFVRGQLVKQNIDPSRVFSISYGKEMPADLEHTRTAWAKNRRCEFKLYEKPTLVQR